MIAAQLARWRRTSRRRPLACWKAWDSPNTSQKALCLEMEKKRTVLALGGNRSGKTEWLRAVVVAMVLGSDHPDARAFWIRNGCNPDNFPKGPGKGWLIARRSNDSINYHRRQIGRLLPGGSKSPLTRWWNLNGKGEARVEITVPGYEKPAEIVFKSEDQGEDAAQGDSCRIIAHDEEGDTHHVWDECSVRLWDQRGWQIMANTPVKGRTWLYYRFVEKTPPDVAVRWIHSLDNPFLPPEEASKLEENEVLAAARLRGEFVVLRGRVWPYFSRARHVIPVDWIEGGIPPDWPRFRTIDFGTRNPFVCLSSVMTQAPVTLADGRVIPEGSLVVYREHYQAGWVLSQHVLAIRSAEGWVWMEGPAGPVLVPTEDADRIDMTWADPEDPAQLASLNFDHGMDASPAFRAKSEGIDRVASRLGSEGSETAEPVAPSLFFVETCHNCIREMEGYIWREGIRGKTPEEPIKKDDHTCDCVRYLAMGVERW